jgi:glutamate racemase
MNASDEKPIGIFDSGLGGLTVASAIKQVLPNEHIIYFGDTAHLPYGDKSKETIIHYSTQITRFLLEKNCKSIVIACNTASANAFNAVKQLVADRSLVFNVVDPVVEEVTGNGAFKHIGVIGTKSTIQSDTYASKIKTRSPATYVSSMATPLFVPMIEEGFIFDDISNAIIRNYLSRHEIGSIEALILGCTHYPIIKNQISKYYNFSVDVFDSARIVAEYVKKQLHQHGLMRNDVSTEGQKTFYVSDYTDYFKIIARMFFDSDITLEHIKL